MRPKFQRPPPKQPTPLEIRDELLRFIRTKFYPDDNVEFAKDQPRLLKWVVLRFAKYLDDHGHTLAPRRYLEIMRDQILMEALRHGEEYLEEAKSIRASVDAALFAAGPLRQAAPDAVRELAAAERLVKAGKAKRGPKNTPVKDQLTLL